MLILSKTSNRQKASRIIHSANRVMTAFVHAIEGINNAILEPAPQQTPAQAEGN